MCPSWLLTRFLKLPACSGENVVPYVVLKIQEMTKHLQFNKKTGIQMKKLNKRKYNLKKHIFLLETSRKNVFLMSRDKNQNFASVVRKNLPYDLNNARITKMQTKNSFETLPNRVYVKRSWKNSMTSKSNQLRYQMITRQCRYVCRHTMLIPQISDRLPKILEIQLPVSTKRVNRC